MSTAILLIAHGSRRSQANADLRVVAHALKARLPEQIVEIAYLELADPGIPAGLQACLDQGSQSIKILPYFLSAGAHVTEDLERFRREFEMKNPAIKCQLCPPLGLHPLILDVLIDRLNEAI